MGWQLIGGDPATGDVHLPSCLWEKRHPNANTMTRLLPPLPPPVP
jgi:hypothetical protein